LLPLRNKLFDATPVKPPYSAGEDYVDTLVYWHHNPEWGFGS